MKPHQCATYETFNSFAEPMNPYQTGSRYIHMHMQTSVRFIAVSQGRHSSKDTIYASEKVCCAFYRLYKNEMLSMNQREKGKQCCSENIRLQSKRKIQNGCENINPECLSSIHYFTYRQFWKWPRQTRKKDHYGDTINKTTMNFLMS